jgi:DNA-binding beta-propeller fold protein YncE
MWQDGFLMVMIKGIKKPYKFIKKYKNSFLRGDSSMRTRRSIGIILIALCSFFLVVVVFSPAVSAGRSLPAVYEVGQITMDKSKLWAPGAVAIGSGGTVYVADGYRNHVLQFDASGNYVDEIKFPKVSAIAVTSDDTLYIGSHDDYSVAVVKNGETIGHLGKGMNEFRSIKDIAIDEATGSIYVADQAGNTVKVFTASGKEIGAIGGVHLPSSIAITEDSIYIIDAPVVQTRTESTTASRISIFDKAYNRVAAIEDNDKYTMSNPTDLAVADGILYITDAARNAVLLFDTGGTFRGEIQSIDDDISTAVGLAISPDGIIYVSSIRTRSIGIFAITAQHDVRTTPDTSGY